MRTLYDSLIDNIYLNNVIEEYAILEAEEIINESFKSSLLTDLAKAIHKAEEEHREHDRKQEQYYKEKGYLSKPSKTEKSFTSIFGPMTVTKNYNKKTGVQGIKWNEITDDDFKKYTTTDDKELQKIFRDVYGKKKNADMICCKPGTKDIIYFIKGYGQEVGEVHVYGFNIKSWLKGVREKTAPKYKYDERPLKKDEALDLIDGLDIYVLEITDSMKKEYQDLHIGREELQKGVINFDKDSLASLLKSQQARYKTLAAEMRAKKLQLNPDLLFDEIKATNDKVVELYKRVISEEKFMGTMYDLNCLMQYVTNAYDSFYRYAKETKSADEFDKKYPEAKGKWNFNRSNAEGFINDTKEYVEKVKKMIKDIENQL